MFTTRQDAIKRYGLDTLYAQRCRDTFEAWTYSDGQRVFFKPFYTLEGLQQWAKRHRYGIVYLD